MSMNDTPSSERLHIGFFGRRNAGKSSVVNAVTGQDMAVVSDTKGTTTDPVTKSMELLPVGPVVIIDTPGFDDEGALGELRVRKTRQILNRTDVAVLIVDATEGLTDCDRDLLRLFREKELPYVLVWNKVDLLSEDAIALRKQELPQPHQAVFTSALQGTGIFALKEAIAQVGADCVKDEGQLLSDLLTPGEIVVLVIPIDKAAPKGRIILPQQMMLRGVLDAGCIPICAQEENLAEVLVILKASGRKPRVVITDSQIFAAVSKIVPDDTPLTSFSILMARYKGLLWNAVAGAQALDALQDGDTVLISEGCTHHRQCGDIGTQKLPAWMRAYTGKELQIETSSGKGFPEDLTKYALILHCGGCMLNDREVQYRMKCAADQGIPMTNYGIAIAKMKGILERSIRVLLQEEHTDL